MIDTEHNEYIRIHAARFIYTRVLCSPDGA